MTTTTYRPIRGRRALFSGWVCTDCEALLANGETPVDMPDEDTAAWLDTVSRAHAGNVTLGLMESRADYKYAYQDCHADDCPNFRRPRLTGRRRRAAARAGRVKYPRRVYDGCTDEPCETKDFSWASCDLCERALAGYRAAVVFW